MEKVFKKDIHTGYKIGEHIEVHGHIHDPESWFLTIRLLNILGKSLCKKSCTEKEIVRHIFTIMDKERIVVNTLINVLMKEL